MGNLKGLVVADDLTGACDSGAVFVRFGHKVTVRLRGPWPQEGITVVSTASREDSPEVARRKVRQACEEADVRRRGFLFKKVDSVMRGNVAEEIEAMLEASGRAEAVLCPAFPEQGRLVRDGQIVVGDRTIPIPCGKGITVCDAVSRAELDALAMDLLARRPMPLLAGSAGLAGSAARALGGEQKTRGGSPRWGGLPAFCIGSLHPVTLGQLEWLTHSPRTGYKVVRIETACPDFEVEGPLFLCGGDTAAMVCEKLDVQAIELLGEVSAGVPYGRLVGGVADGWGVVTKSGGFGDERILGRVLDVLSGGEWLESQ